MSTTDILMPSWTTAHFKRQEEPVEAIPTPFPSWNRHSRDAGGGVGLALGWYSIIGGGTGDGKTLLGLNLAAEAMKHGISPAFISLEMSLAQLATRLYAILTRTPVRRLERGDDYETATATSVIQQLKEMRDRTGIGFYTNREPTTGLTNVLETMDYFRSERNVKLFFVDYLQLVSYGDEQDTVNQVTKISHAVRSFAARHKVTVVALSQYNRATSANRHASPIPQSLIGSSALENDSDQTLLLDHSRYERSPDGLTAKTWAVLGKNRHGSTGEFGIEWDFRTLTVREAMPDEEGEWPQRRVV
jgi:replicative DNA helicase